MVTNNPFQVLIFQFNYSKNWKETGKKSHRVEQIFSPRSSSEWPGAPGRPEGKAGPNWRTTKVKYIQRHPKTMWFLVAQLLLSPRPKDLLYTKSRDSQDIWRGNEEGDLHCFARKSLFSWSKGPNFRSRAYNPVPSWPASALSGTQVHQKQRMHEKTPPPSDVVWKNWKVSGWSVFWKNKKMCMAEQLG